ncbi:MAG: phenylacetate--CoA ligase family protein, partial [Dehalococcoidia bacterium]
MNYWNPRTELMPREELQKWQLRKLKTMVRWAYKSSTFWRERLERAGISPDEVKELKDIEAFPFLTKTEFIDNQSSHPPYGDILSVSADISIAYHQTSGTSGRAPLRVVETPRDWQWGANAWACGLYAFGLRTGDIVYLAFGYGVFQGFWGVHYAVQKVGATTVAGGAQSSENRIRQILELGVTVVVSTPTYAIRLAQVAEQMGVNLADDSRVRLLIHAGEPGASIAATKSFIEKYWGARAGDFAGMTESAGIFSFECSQHPNGMHMMEDQFLIEVIDPETGSPLEYGQRGELVITSFGKGSFPLIRYRTGDLVARVPANRCSCGRSFDIFEGGILGRID